MKPAILRVLAYSAGLSFLMVSGMAAAPAHASPPAGAGAGAVAAVAAVTTGPGYRLFAGDGGVFSFGSSKFLGSATTRCSHQCFSAAATPDGAGYWILDTFPATNSAHTELYGYGSVSDVKDLPAGSSAVASDATGKGGWVLNGDSGQVVPFGDAVSYGDPSGLHLMGATVTPFGSFSYFQGIVGTPDGHGYWIVGMDGGVFAYGDAGFHGSTGGVHLDAPVVGLTRTNDGRGYWLVALDGGIFSFGDAAFHGSMGGRHLNEGMISIAANPGGTGYWTVALDGGVFSFGDAPFLGSLGGVRLAGAVYAIAAS